MFSKGSVIKVLLVCVLAVAAQFIFRRAVMLGVFSHYHPHYPGSCKKLDGIQPGSEGFHTLTNGLTLITSGFRVQNTADGVLQHFQRHNIKGRVYLFDFKKSKEGVKELKIVPSKDFNVDTFFPHGISVWEDKKSGRYTVFIVNHCLAEPGVEKIEKFVFNPRKLALVHVASYSHDCMRGMNDVQATGENSFYFTNSYYFRGPPLTLLELCLNLQLADVVYFDGNGYKSVASSLYIPNGIAMSNDQQYVYVAAIMSHKVHVYKRNKDNSLTEQQVFHVGSMTDNPTVDPKTGHLYIGNHPIGYKAFAHLDDPQLRTPSQVLQLEVKDGNITSTLELLYDDGELISGSSTAMVYDGKMLVGSVHDSLVLCDVNVPLSVQPFQN